MTLSVTKNPELNLNTKTIWYSIKDNQQGLLYTFIPTKISRSCPLPIFIWECSRLRFFREIQQSASVDFSAKVKPHFTALQSAWMLEFEEKPGFRKAMGIFSCPRQCAKWMQRASAVLQMTISDGKGKQPWPSPTSQNKKGRHVAQWKQALPFWSGIIC